MAVRIRLRRIGAKKKPFYRVVVADSRSPRNGRFLDTIGWFDPLAEPVKIKIDEAKAMRWLEGGAEPTDSARSLLSKAGIWQRFRGGTSAPGAGARAAEAPEAESPAVESPEAGLASEAAGPAEAEGASAEE